MRYLRPVDTWFINHVLPHEAVYVAVARRLCGNADDAQDLLHDAYAQLLLQKDWETIQNPRRYVLRMLHNLAVQRMRRARVIDFRQLSELSGFDPADDAPDGFHIVDSRDQLRRLMRALDSLPARCREVVLLRRFEELAPRDIARRLGLSLSTMEKRLARGLALLAHAMEGSIKAPDKTKPPASTPQPRKKSVNS